MNEPVGRFGSARTIGRGMRVAPALSNGIGLTFLFAFIGTGARLVIPILIQLSIDHGLQPGNVRVSYIGLLGLIGSVCVLISSASLRIATKRLGTRAEEGLFTLRIKLFDHIHRLSLADHNDEKRGALVSRVTSDIETLTMFFSWGGLSLLLDGSQMIAVASVMLAYDWRLALVALSVSAPLILVLRLVQSRLVYAHNISRERNAQLLGVFSEMVSGAETLRAYNATDLMITSVAKDVRNRGDSNIRAGVIGAFLFPSGEVFAVFTVMAVVGAGLLIGPSGGLSAGALVGFVFLTYRFLEPIAEFTEVIDQTQSAVASLRRVLGVLDTPIGPPQPTSPILLPNGVLSIDFVDVSFAYGSRLGEVDDDTPVLSSINLHVPGGQHIALVGPSGSGKTTLARLIARLADPTVGSVMLGGVALHRVDNADLRQRLIVVPQEPFLFADTIAYNLRFASPDATDSELRDVFRDLEIDDWLDALPQGINTNVGQRGGSLSAGERQLIALVRAAVVRPDVLILDEATSSVDALTEVRISKALSKLALGRTTVSIAHRLSTAARAERVILLEQGKILEDGSHRQLLAANGRYAKQYETWVTSTQSNLGS
ncbi:MAG: ABC transporter ATP-binding protein [Ilumatobacteraceae bacterium]